VPTIVVVPAVGSCSRTSPVRAVWMTRLSGSTSNSMGSPRLGGAAITVI